MLSAEASDTGLVRAALRRFSKNDCPRAQRSPEPLIRRVDRPGSDGRSAIGQVRDVYAYQHGACSTGHTEHAVAGDDKQEPTRELHIMRARRAALGRWR